MSRLNPTATKSPVTKTFKWAGKKGYVIYWDKEKEKDVIMQLPFKFLYLDSLNTITGFVKSAKGSYYSNAVRNLQKESFTVRLGKDKVIEGLYEEIKDNKAIKGAKFAKKIFIAIYAAEGLELAEILLSGSAMGKWFDFCKKNDVEQGAVHINSFTNEVNGDNEYMDPVFTWAKVDDFELDKAALDLNKKLEVYLITYFKTGNNIEEVPPNTPESDELLEATKRSMQTEPGKYATNPAESRETLKPTEEQDDLPF